jgi:hypothetical protein
MCTDMYAHTPMSACMCACMCVCVLVCVCVSQEKMEKEKGLGWHRLGSDVLYKRNEYQYTKPNSNYIRSFYSLHFSIQVTSRGRRRCIIRA